MKHVRVLGAAATLLLTTHSAYAEDGRVELRWRSGSAHLHVEPPNGKHVSPDAPARLQIIDAEGVTRLSSVSIMDLDRLTFGVGAGPWKVDLSVAFCTDTTCAFTHFQWEGTLAGNHGAVVLLPVTEVVAVGHHGSAVKLYDFAAVWCPPCNLLAAEVLHDPDDGALFATLPIEAVDVDRPDSWPLKSRYSVGGYPTLIAVDVDGNEVDRLVGYPGEAPTKEWIADLANEMPLWQLEQAAEGEITLDGLARARAARRLASAQKVDAAKAYFVGATDGVNLRIARLTVEERPEDAAWLVTNALTSENFSASNATWLLTALTVSPELWTQAAPLVARLAPNDAADCLDRVAESVEKVQPDEARMLRAAAISAVLSTQTGDPNHDRAQVTFLADLYVGIGDSDQAIHLLQTYRDLFPDEFTFHSSLAKKQLDAGHFPEAASAAREALRTAFGDQRLRAAVTLARVLQMSGDIAGAKAVLESEIAATPAVPAEIHVRTTRYLGEAAKLRAELGK